MDFVVSMISIATDANRKDKQFRNLTTQLNYVLEKTKKFHSKADPSSHVYIFIENLIKRAQQMSKKMSQLMEEKNLSMQLPQQLYKQKIRLSLPFDKTKDQLKELIELLEKGSNQLKEHLEQLQQNNQNENIQQGVKRKFKTHTLYDSSVDYLPIREVQSEDPFDPSEDMMGPTIKQDQDTTVQKNIQFVIQLKGQEKVIQTIKKAGPDLLSIHSKIPIKDHHEILLYTLARKNFSKVYKPLKQVLPDIDRISKENHFSIVWKRNASKQQSHKDSRTQKLSDKFHGQHHTSSKKVQNQDQFFSFPAETLSKNNEKGQIILYKTDITKTVYQQKEDQWIKIDHGCQLKNGDRIAGFLRPDQINNKQAKPSFYFELKFNLPE